MGKAKKNLEKFFSIFRSPISYIDRLFNRDKPLFKATKNKKKEPLLVSTRIARIPFVVN